MNGSLSSSSPEPSRAPIGETGMLWLRLSRLNDYSWLTKSVHLPIILSIKTGFGNMNAFYRKKLKNLMERKFMQMGIGWGWVFSWKLFIAFTKRVTTEVSPKFVAAAGPRATKMKVNRSINAPSGLRHLRRKCKGSHVIPYLGTSNKALRKKLLNIATK